MERLRKRIWPISIAFLLAGTALSLTPKVKQVDRTEEEVAKVLPVKVGRFDAVMGQGETCSYTMDKSTYDVLKPWGIVARVFADGNEQYDVVAIVSRSKESFHDPQICFTAQGWNLTNQRHDVLKTKTRGDVPITLVDMENGGVRTVAMYFFKTTQGYFGDMSKVKMSMLTYKLTHFMKDDEGAFIRVIPKGVVDVPRMKIFVADWVDEAGKVSAGYY
jgi:hypothetical protein